MKAWIISLFLFAAMLAVIIGNAIYVRHVTEHVVQELQSLSVSDPFSAERLERLDAYWQHHKKYVALSISYRELDRLCEMLLSLRVAQDEKNAVNFELYRRLSVDAAEEVARLERFSVENLF